MNTTFYIRKLLVLSAQMAIVLLCAACASLNPTQQADRDFYKEHSKKMGVKFTGNEDKEIIKASAQWMGVPYRYGGQTKKGVDCSGFVGGVYKEAYGLTLPRSSKAMAKQVKRVRKNELICGDLVFFTIKDKRVSHVGIYMGDGKFIHASTNYGVSIANLGDSYWSKYFSGAGRVSAVAQLHKTAKSNAQVESAPKSNKKIVPATDKKEQTIDQESTQKSNSDDIIVVFDEEF